MKWLPLLLLTACASAPKLDGPLPEAEFVETIVRPWCVLLAQCSRGEFDATYSNLDECRTGEATLWQGLLDEYTGLGCSYSDAGGAAFYEMFVEMECGEFFLETYFTDDLDTLFSCG